MAPSIYKFFVLGAFLTCVLTPMIRHLALKCGFVDCPQRARKVHEQATPRLGGAAILISFLLTVTFAGFSYSELKNLLWGESPVIGPILLGSIGIFVIGFLDDLSRLTAKIKLLGEFLIVGLVIWGANLSFSSLQFLGFVSITFPEWIGFGLACFWIVGMANAINLIDGLDGLAAGTTLVGLMALSVVGYLASITSVVWTSTLLMGCLLGFLVYNSRPASIFLGDCGSLTIGYLAGCLGLLASIRLRQDSMVDGVFLLLPFALPVADCFFAIFRRMIRGRSPFSPDMEHLHHRLMAKGLSHGRAVLTIWAVAFFSSLLAIASAFGKGDQLFAVFVLFGFGGFVLFRYLGYFRFEFFGKDLNTIIEDRKSTKSLEQAVKEAEQIISNSNSLEDLPTSLARAAEGLQFHDAKISFFCEKGQLGVDLGSKSPDVGKVFSWGDSDQLGYFSRDQEFSVEFPLSGRNFSYGKIEYRFLDGRSGLTVQEEILLERIHDALSNLAGRLRKKDKFPKAL